MRRFYAGRSALGSLELRLLPRRTLICVEAFLRWRGATVDGSSQLRMREASAIRVYLPQESRSTMMILRPASFACITRQRPASLMYPVFERPISQLELRISRLVL